VGLMECEEDDIFESVGEANVREYSWDESAVEVIALIYYY